MSDNLDFKYELGVVGLGYVGLPLAVEASLQDLNVVGYDINSERVEMINNGLSPIEDISTEELSSALKNFHSTIDSKELSDCKNVVISVPTPLTDYQPDLSYVIDAAKTVQIGTPSMRDLPQFMARGLEIHQQIEVTYVAHIGPNIGFFGDAGLIACGRQAIVSAPAPQSARLLTNGPVTTKNDPILSKSIQAEIDCWRQSFCIPSLFYTRNYSRNFAIYISQSTQLMNTFQPVFLSMSKC